MAWKSAVRIELDEAERRELEARTRRRKISRADAMRAEIVLLAADGTTNLASAAQLGVSRLTVGTWRQRFPAKRLAGLAASPRPGTPPPERGHGARRGPENGQPRPTRGGGRPRCSPPSQKGPEPSAENAWRAAGRRNPAASPTRSNSLCPPISTFTSSWTMPRAIR